MKKTLLALMIAFVLGCNDGAETTSTTSTETVDSVGMTNPSAIDTMQHPTGITTGSVISTDTAAMKVHPNPEEAAKDKK